MCNPGKGNQAKGKFTPMAQPPRCWHPKENIFTHSAMLAKSSRSWRHARLCRRRSRIFQAEVPRVAELKGSDCRSQDERTIRETTGMWFVKVVFSFMAVFLFSFLHGLWIFGVKVLLASRT